VLLLLTIPLGEVDGRSGGDPVHGRSLLSLRDGPKPPEFKISYRSSIASGKYIWRTELPRGISGTPMRACTLDIQVIYIEKYSFDGSISYLQ
jgi:hypothetical protein